jgi:acyl-coenzyme A thioesterase PaaI-like protein
MLPDWLFFRAIRFYPPYLGAGVRARLVPDTGGGSVLEIRMRLRFWNRNALGTHFGGSLYSMCDPFYVLLLIRRLGKDYIVWDKAASIDFLRPGRGTVRASFRLTDEIVLDIKERADRGEKVEPLLHVDVVDEAGEIVARVAKRLYVRKRTGVAEK